MIFEKEDRYMETEGKLKHEDQAMADLEIEIRAIEQ